MSQFVWGHDTGGGKRRSMSLAGSYLFCKELPIEDDRSLPGFELRIERLSKTA